MRIIGMLLLLTGNISFGLEQPVSQCQSFVARVFDRYGLPLPGTEGFPSYKDFNLVNYDQEKPEFEIMTIPVEIKRQPLYFLEGTFIVEQKDHLKFEGKNLDDGSYELVVSEIDPRSQQSRYMQSLLSIRTIRTPLVHNFHFSEDCEFNEYRAHQLDVSALKGNGFLVSANAQCEFDEPKKGEDLTARILVSLGPTLMQIIVKPVQDNYVILEYPHYYRGLCALAKNNELTAL